MWPGCESAIWRAGEAAGDRVTAGVGEQRVWRGKEEGCSTESPSRARVASTVAPSWSAERWVAMFALQREGAASSSVRLRPARPLCASRSFPRRFCPSQRAVRALSAAPSGVARPGVASRSKSVEGGGETSRWRASWTVDLPGRSCSRTW
ncbi:hypothetical protein BJY59DRAFT_22211 [Rhodotorula toruloides]